MTEWPTLDAYRDLAPASRKAVLACTLLTIAMGVYGLGGWATDGYGMTGEARIAYAFRPMGSLAALAGGFALLAALGRADRFVPALLSLPFAAGFLSLLDYAVGSAPLVNLLPALSWPSGETIAPRLLVGIQIILTATAILLVRRRSATAGRIVASLASATFLLGLVSFSGILLLSGDNQVLRHLHPSIIGVATSLTLPAALLFLKREHSLFSLLGFGGVEGRVAGIAIPLVLVTPILTEVLAAALERIGWLSAGMGSVIAMTVNVLTMTALFVWVMKRLSVEHHARRALVSALDSAPIALTAANGEILHWSKGCERLYGWDRKEARGRTKDELLQTTRISSRKTAEPGGDNEAWDEEVYEQTRTGERRHVLEHGRVLGVAAGKPVLVVSMTDITDRTRAETALRDSQARLKLAIEAHGIGVVEYDHKTGRLHWPDEAQVQLGLEPGTITDLDSWLAQIDPTDRQHLLNGFSAAAKQRLSNSTFRFRIGPPDGRRTVEGRMHWVYDSEGRLERTVSVGIDVSERDKAEARITALQRALTHASRVSTMGEMAAGFAHELNQPLAAIVNFLGAASFHLKGKEQAPARDLLEMASGQALRTAEIIRRLKDLVANRPPRMAEEPVREVVEEAIELALTGVDTRGVDVSICGEGVVPAMLADRVQIQQVLVNLIRNAVEALHDFAVDRPAVVVRARSRGPMIELLIEDNGPGLADEILDRLYEPFISTKSDGMGVGLSICRRIVEAHGGELDARNNAAGGAIFQFTVPSHGMAGEQREYA